MKFYIFHQFALYIFMKVNSLLDSDIELILLQEGKNYMKGMIFLQKQVMMFLVLQMVLFCHLENMVHLVII